MTCKTIFGVLVMLMLSGKAFSEAPSSHSDTIIARIIDMETREPIVGSKVFVIDSNIWVHFDFTKTSKIQERSQGIFYFKPSKPDHLTIMIDQLVGAADSSTQSNLQLVRIVDELNRASVPLSKKRIMDKYGLNPVLSIHEEVITARPVRTVDELLELVSEFQVLTSEFFFWRGGRSDEVSFIVDGIPLDETGSGMYLTLSCCSVFTGNVNGDMNNSVDIDDISFLIDHLFVNMLPLECPKTGNVDGDPNGIVDIGDLIQLIDHLFINFPPTAPCQ